MLCSFGKIQNMNSVSIGFHLTQTQISLGGSEFYTCTKNKLDFGSLFLHNMSPSFSHVYSIWSLYTFCWCLKYILNYSIIHYFIYRFTECQLFTKYCARNWGYHVKEDNWLLSALIKCFLKEERDTQYSLMEIITRHDKH